MTIINVFVSHSWKYSGLYNKIMGFMQNSKRISIRDFSVPKHDPLDASSVLALRKALEEQIRHIHVLIILTGMYVGHSEWIQEEIKMAKKYGKPILGVCPRGQERESKIATDAAYKVVRWHEKSIIDGVVELFETRKIVTVK